MLTMVKKKMYIYVAHILSYKKGVMINTVGIQASFVNEKVCEVCQYMTDL